MIFLALGPMVSVKVSVCVCVCVCVCVQIRPMSRRVFQHVNALDTPPYIGLFTPSLTSVTQKITRAKRNSPGKSYSQEQHKQRMRGPSKNASNIESLVDPLIVPHIKTSSLHASMPACWSTSKVTSPPSEKYIGHSLCL